MAAAMVPSFSVAASAKPVPLGTTRFGSTRLQGLGLHSQALALRTHTIAYGYSRAGRRPRPFALAEQQQASSQTEAEVEEKLNEAEESSPQTNGTDSKAAAEETPAPPPSVTSGLLRRYSEAVLAKDEATMTNIQAELEMLEKENTSLGQLVANLTEEVSIVKERLLRLNADFDNFRKRSDREKESLRETVKGDVVESLLPMIDNFERAKSAIKAETEGEKKIDSSYQSIYKQFVDIMKGLGVKVIDTVGKEFNPEVHEAIMREESTEFPEGYIIQEFRRGFMIGNKLLRPAMVKVSAGKPNGNNNTSSSKTSGPEGSTDAATQNSSLEAEVGAANEETEITGASEAAP